MCCARNNVLDRDESMGNRIMDKEWRGQPDNPQVPSVPACFPVRNCKGLTLIIGNVCVSRSECKLARLVHTFTPELYSFILPYFFPYYEIGKWMLLSCFWCYLFCRPISLAIFATYLVSFKKTRN